MRLISPRRKDRSRFLSVLSSEVSSRKSWCGSSREGRNDLIYSVKILQKPCETRMFGEFMTIFDIRHFKQTSRGKMGVRRDPMGIRFLLSHLKNNPDSGVIFLLAEKILWSMVGMAGHFFLSLVLTFRFAQISVLASENTLR